MPRRCFFAHLFDPTQLRPYKRGVEYVDFRPNRVAMQDATAQMALLQFMNAGKDKVAVPASVHCDHLFALMWVLTSIFLRLARQIKRSTIS